MYNIIGVIESIRSRSGVLDFISQKELVEEHQIKPVLHNDFSESSIARLMRISAVHRPRCFMNDRVADFEQ